MKDDRLISLKKALAEIDAMPPIKAEGHDFIEKTCLKTRLKLLSPAQQNCNTCLKKMAVINNKQAVIARAFQEGVEMGEKNAQPRWIPVTERLPTENNSYLVWMPYTPEGHHITVAEWCGSYWNIKTPVAAWMPLPQL